VAVLATWGEKQQKCPNLLGITAESLRLGL